jgi:hypothetical protein
MEDDHLQRLRDEYEELAAEARRLLREGKTDTEVRELKQKMQDAQSRKQK